MKKLLFVCSQNRLCSPTAEAVFSEYEGLEVDSAGLNRKAEIPLCSEVISGQTSFLLGKSPSPQTLKNVSALAQKQASNLPGYPR